MEPDWKSDADLYALMRQKLYTAVVGDILDSLQRCHQFLPPAIQCLRTDMVVVGRAMPVQLIDVEGFQQRPFGLLTDALDALRPGEVYVATGGTAACASWGELLTAAARTRGAVGAVINGFHRDTHKVLEQGWPVFSRGRYAQDASVRSAVSDFRCVIEIDGVRIEPGDLIFGDLDGVVVIPREFEDEVIPRALEKARGEKTVRQAIEGGMSATAAFRQFGIL